MKKLFWGAFLLLTFIVSLPATWLIMSKADFFYSALYDNIGIAEHVNKYAPRNTQGKADFVDTSKSERVELFHGVVVAINQHGKGLDELVYTGFGKQEKQLFTQAEVTHLQDVANLLDKLKPLVIGFVLLWLIIVATLKLKKIALPSGLQLLLNLLIILVLLSAILAIGPEKIFNQLHMWVFPDKHQWFFYYEESLMSTMMKAPDLFAYIAAIWAVLSMVLSALLILIVKKLN